MRPTSIARRVALATLLLMAAACGSQAPASPTPTGRPEPADSPAPANRPPLSGPSRTFTFDPELSGHVTSITTTSRFVLYDDGAFALQYEGIPQYQGSYTQVNDQIVFTWDGSPAWGATGTLAGQSLSVHYNLTSQLDDFEDAVYTLTS